ncbi:MAG: winged helix DNA-binding protein [Rhodocyclaceae bacterium]|mgnify:CR=1 FL=1|jgi:predicted MarR family transcription regulator|nr:winged helix DNA-binding protein [Rhodocyclaceae bacterium]MBK6554614.1 winged helix DNA-binding protein [Rhodocyclaceae bacterium]MBK6677451.1 winged helix DNA-binding protein [Rhodocyclaceae bacterium]MBK7813991.1 winged helix DNA-binding protein [Rhodocyclaceae bacterium]MBK9310107.1 winged helix DNA-binding protein [Rhodocyclaceae bacterium]
MTARARATTAGLTELPVGNGIAPTTGWHLSRTPLEAATTELEWALLRWWEAFGRYSLHALNMLGLDGVGSAEMLILHIVRLHDRPKSATMIANLLNRDDIQNVQYSLRKLVGMGLAAKVRDQKGKYNHLAVTERGRQICDDFAAIRAQLLIADVAQLDNGEAVLLQAAKTVSMLTGLYDSAGRTSTGYAIIASAVQS